MPRWQDLPYWRDWQIQLPVNPERLNHLGADISAAIIAATIAAVLLPIILKLVNRRDRWQS